MTPLTFITGVLLGTCGVIGFGLLVVLLQFMLLGTSEPRVATELTALGVSAALFLIMTAVCAVSFITLLRKSPWRWPAQAVMWAGVLGIGFYFLA